MSNNKYEKAKVYKIWSTRGDKIYVGSTCKDYLSQRMTAHRCSYRQWKSKSIKYTSSFLLFDEYGLENCFIELLEAKECNSKDELSQLEGKYIRDLACVNRIISGRTQKRYVEDNNDKINLYQEQYRQDHQEKNKQYQKQYKQINRDYILEQKCQKHHCKCGGKFTHDNKSNHEKTILHRQFIESQINLIQ